MSATVEQAMLEPEMNGETVTVTMQVPKTVYNRAQKIAARENRRLEELWSEAADEGLRQHETARELWEQVSASYRARLAAQGKLDQTPEEVLADLAKIRQEVADELYPNL